MIKNHVEIAVRNLLRNKGFAKIAAMSRNYSRWYVTKAGRVKEILLVTLSYQAIEAAMRNPVKSLRR